MYTFGMDTRSASSLAGEQELPTSLSQAISNFDESIGDLPPHRFLPQPTGFPWIDEVLAGGTHAQHFYLVLGKQNVGKTILILQMARHQAIWATENKYPIAPVLFCYEHTSWSMFVRLLCMESWEVDPDAPLTYKEINEALVKIKMGKTKVGEENILKGKFRETNFMDELFATLPDIAMKAYQKIARYADHLFIYHPSRVNTNVEEIIKIISLIQQDFQVTPIPYIDYLQAMPPPRKLWGASMEMLLNKELVVGMNTRLLKAYAEKAYISIIAVSSVDEDALRNPAPVHLEDADGSEILPFTIDVGLVINRDTMREKSNGKASVVEKTVRLAIEKNRNHGPADIERRHDILGGSFFINPEGTKVTGDNSFQRNRIKQDTGD